jgi:hypothetical protein
MFRRNPRTHQPALFSDLNLLPAHQRERLDQSWAGTFRREVFERLDERAFAGLYSDVASRPNVPVNVLVGLETLKAGCGWSDAELHDAFTFNVQVRYAVGYENLGDGEFDLRTVYNFRGRVSDHQQATGENLFDHAFAQITDEQVAAFQIKTNRLRMDSTQLASNVRHFSRLQLLVEVAQRVHRMLTEAERVRYAERFQPYVRGTSGQFMYHLKGETTTAHLQQLGELFQTLLTDLEPTYAAHDTYQLLARVFREQFQPITTVAPLAAAVPTPDPALSPVSGPSLADLPESPVQLMVEQLNAPASGPSPATLIVPAQPTASPDLHPVSGPSPIDLPGPVQPKPGTDIRPASVQSPDDLDATYRSKRGVGYTGYVANITETSDPDNPFQLILHTQTASNTTDDTVLLREALPTLVERTAVDTIDTDGGYGGPEVDAALRPHDIVQIQTAFRGLAPDPERVTLADFEPIPATADHPERLTCPYGQTADLEPGRNPDRFIAHFECPPDCPLLARCPTRTRQTDTRRSLRVDQADLDLAQRRRLARAARAEPGNPRAAVESTVGALKRPFSNDQLPVRGRFRMGQMIVGSALMVNLRRIHRYVSEKILKAQPTAEATADEATPPSPALSFFVAIRTLLAPRRWPWVLGC